MNYYYTAYLKNRNDEIMFELPFVYTDIKICAQQFYSHYVMKVEKIPHEVNISTFDDVVKIIKPNDKGLSIIIKRFNVDEYDQH